jgi:glutaredoxin
MMEDPKTMDALVSFIGNFRTVPQILVNEVHVGGFEGLVKHLNKGE